MKDNIIVVGSVVLSKKGRDQGCYFVALATDGEYVLIADGDKHMLGNPKRKNPKHLKPAGQILEGIADKLHSGKKVFDSEVKSALRVFNQQ